MPQKIKVEYKTEIPSADSFLLLYQTTEWDKEGKKQEQPLHDAIKNSWYMVSAFRPYFAP